jgi:hypothetical protein
LRNHRRQNNDKNETSGGRDHIDIRSGGGGFTVRGGSCAGTDEPGHIIAHHTGDRHRGRRPFTGTFQLKKFVVQDGVLMASGILSGTVTTAAGVVGTILKTILIPVTIGQTTCEILHLDLGPLSLDLLGLQIDLSRIVLDITAQAGAGNLLGNLLCAVANLLNDPSGLAKLLNSILAILG